MKLILFPTKIENPFPHKIRTGELTPLSESCITTLGGIGNQSSESLRSILKKSDYSFTAIVEFGGAAAVQNAEIGHYYESSTFIDENGLEVYHQKQQTALDNASIISCNKIFCENQQLSYNIPEADTVIYSMESLSLLNICKKNKIPFISIRLVSDRGMQTDRNALYEQYKAVITENKKKTADLLLQLCKES